MGQSVESVLANPDTGIGMGSARAIQLMWLFVFVLSTAEVAGQPEVNRNQEEHLVGLLSLARQPAASHLPLQTP